MTNTDDGVGRRRASRGWHHVCVLAERRCLPTQARGARTNLCSTCAITAYAATSRDYQSRREELSERKKAVRRKCEDEKEREKQRRNSAREQLPENHNLRYIAAINKYKRALCELSFSLPSFLYYPCSSFLGTWIDRLFVFVFRSCYIFNEFLMVTFRI